MSGIKAIITLEQRAIAQRAAALELYALGGQDKRALRLLDAADVKWRRVRALRRAGRL